MPDVSTTRLPDRPTREMVSRRTRILLRILALVLVVMIGLLVARVVSGDLAWWQMLAGWLSGRWSAWCWAG